jgi:transcriptional regulator with XRE-family HTH domain
MDTDAAERLRREVARLYESKAQRRFAVDPLARESGISRQALTNWLVNGKAPDPELLSKLADYLETDAKKLWAAWLDIGQDSALSRIADALERAYPTNVLGGALEPEDLEWVRRNARADVERLSPHSDDPPPPPAAPRPDPVDLPSPGRGVDE